MAMYCLYHPGFEPQRWQIFIIFAMLLWIVCLIIAFCQPYLHKIATWSVFASLGGWVISLILVAALPSKTGYGHATHSFVWTEWTNLTGWSSNVFVFLAGSLNGAWTIGTLDSITHMAEEMPDPRRNIPKATFCYLAVGTITTFSWYAVLLYAITDMSAVADSPLTTLPLAGIFQQAARSDAGTMALLCIFFFASFPSIPGLYLTTSRILWTLGRDHALPFSDWVGRTDPKHKNPFNAAIATGCIVTCLGLIYVGSSTAFSALVGCFVILSLISYLAAILPNLITRRKYVRPGPFWMGDKVAYAAMGVSTCYTVVMSIIWMFPFAVPFDAATVNYASLICGGATILITPWYMWKRHHGYMGPIVLMDAADDVQKGHVLVGEALENDRKLRLAAEKLRTEGAH
ncbi:amino acid permease-like protein 4 [Elsinoe australis]|uniref:Amino acid permease-like protein 4 n=1 Tax=Elsinoe australis TaxID=40998 RepID=A0A4U7AXC2_9PEZI|nr:amino acid permease-like protein 4 [Elsinoe australis]